MSESTTANTQLTTDLPPAKGKRAKNLSQPAQAYGPPAQVGVSVDVDLVDEDPENARLVFDDTKLRALAEDLKQGQLVSIIVRTKPGGRFVLEDGARRLRAARLAGLQTLRADVYEHDDAGAAVAAATANLGRENLTPLEEARAYSRLRKAGFQARQICDRYGVAFNTYKARMELLELPQDIAQRIGVGGFLIGHAQALLPLAQNPDLLQAGLRAMLDADQLPEAREAATFVGDALVAAGLVTPAAKVLPDDVRWQVDNFEALVKELPHVELENGYGAKQILLTADKAAIDELAARVTAQVSAAEPAADQAEADEGRDLTDDEDEYAQPDKVSEKEAKKEKAKADAERAAMKRHNAIITVEHRLRVEAFAKHLKTGKARTAAAWAAIVDYCQSGGLNETDDNAVAEFIPSLGAALGVEVDMANALVPAMDGDDDLSAKDPPAWFRRLHNPEQLAILAGLQLVHDVAVRGDPDLVRELTGELPSAWHRAAEAEVKKAEKAAETAEVAAKPPKPAKKAAKAKKAPAKPKKAAKETPAVAKARKKLADKKAKGKQTSLVAA